jgi:hypothetical protein
MNDQQGFMIFNQTNTVYSINLTKDCQVFGYDFITDKIIAGMNI